MTEGPCTHVLVTLTLRLDLDPGHAMAAMRGEMIATAALYLSGRIQQWFSQIDERGVLLLFGTTSIEETQTLMADLPLVKANLVTLHFTRLGPLLPLRTLLGTFTA